MIVMSKSLYFLARRGPIGRAKPEAENRTPGEKEFSVKINHRLSLLS
jgi:hypothetical protein